MKIKKLQGNRGMTYIELIVVLIIFSLLTSVALFNHGEFQAKVEIKNLASDIALKIVKAQKSSLGGQLPPAAQQVVLTPTWKPSYGIYFKPSTDNASFIYFVDLPLVDNLYNGDFNCGGSLECLEKISITKNNKILSMEAVSSDGSVIDELVELAVTFSRVDSGATIKSTPVVNNYSYIRINLSSPKSATGAVNIFPSGRIQVN
jgi:prepilin-type N-terminal cleavage/methylation domain-containing protein